MGTSLPNRRLPAIPSRPRRRSRRSASCTQRLAATPVADVITNHAIGIWQLALVHLGVVTPPDEQGRRPAPDLAEAGLAIDALAALVESLGERLGEGEPMLREALSQAQMLFVEIAEDNQAG